ncbi:hypothetical protein, partial [Pseudomonas viridiflava]
GITLSTSMGMIGVLEITLIVPTLRVGMPLRKLRVRSRMWRRCGADAWTSSSVIDVMRSAH